MLEGDPRRRLKVGLFSVLVLALLAASILIIGAKQGLFVRHDRFQAEFSDVRGLVAGAPVWLNGVVVGSVEEVRLPADPSEQKITVVFSVQSRLARRIREDSHVRIGTLGLLGDRYLEISSGSPDVARLKPGSAVPTTESRDVAEVLAKSGDVMTNVLAISGSLRRILERVERGEGVLGELTMSPESGPRVMERLDSVLEQTDAVLRDIRFGRGILGRIIAPHEGDEKMFTDFQQFVAAGRSVMERLDRDLGSDDSVMAALMRDPEGRRTVEAFLANLTTASAGIAAAANDLAEQKGTLGRLIGDQDYAKSFLDDLAGLTESLRGIATKLDNGDGTAGKLLTDPSLYDDMESVIRGVQQSKILTWLIRNRREAGEEAAAEEEAAAAHGG